MERALEPYGLVLKAGVWYLCARVPTRPTGPSGCTGSTGSRRSTVVGERFAPGRGVRPARVLGGAGRAVRRGRSCAPRSSCGSRRTGCARLPYAVDPVAARDALAAAGDPGRRGPGRPSRSPVESEEVAHAQLAALGPEVEVLAPAALRAAVRRRRRDALAAARYADAVQAFISAHSTCAPPVSRADAGPVMDETEFWELVDTHPRGRRGRPRGAGRPARRAAAAARPGLRPRLRPALRGPLQPRVPLGPVGRRLGAARRGERRRVRLLPLLADRPGPGGLRGRGARPRRARRAAGRLRRGDRRGRRGAGLRGRRGVRAAHRGRRPRPGHPARARGAGGTPVDFEDERVLAERYPKLWERFRD